ncbi:unnamed protein product, partial [Choristocarpus tenellus]
MGSGGKTDGGVNIEESIAHIELPEDGKGGNKLLVDEFLHGDSPETSPGRDQGGEVSKGKTLRRWLDTEEKQRQVETGRKESKLQRYGRIYDEVKELRRNTRLSVDDLREVYKKEGIIQNKDQFIVRLIAQERNEKEGKVAAHEALHQWRVTDMELASFVQRLCKRRGVIGKFDLATQWALEQEQAGGKVSFKEGLAFYSSIGVHQPHGSANVQKQWQEWREWEDALSSAL